MNNAGKVKGPKEEFSSKTDKEFPMKSAGRPQHLSKEVLPSRYITIHFFPKEFLSSVVASKLKFIRDVAHRQC